MGNRITDKQWAVLEAALSRYPQINGAKFGFKEHGGTETDEVVLQLSVNKKLPVAELAPADVLPNTFMGYPVDVVKRNPVVPQDTVMPAASSGSGITNERTGTNPVNRFENIAPGMSIGDDEATGTLGCLVTDGVDIYGVTNWHVLKKLGKRVQQPGPVDAGRFGFDPHDIGVVHDHEISDIDAAIFKVKSGVPWTNKPVGMSYVIKGLEEPELGKVYQKVGRTTMLTYGVAVSIGYIRLPYPVGYRNIMSVEFRPIDRTNTANIEISKGGDSGAVWTSSDGNVIAVHYAGEAAEEPSEEVAYGCLITKVLERFDMYIPKNVDKAPEVNPRDDLKYSVSKRLKEIRGLVESIQRDIIGSDI